MMKSNAEGMKERTEEDATHTKGAQDTGEGGIFRIQVTPSKYKGVVTSSIRNLLTQEVCQLGSR